MRRAAVMTTVTLAAAAIALSGCTTPAAPAATSAPAATTPASTTAPTAPPATTAPATTAPEPTEAQGTVFETQNGTARITLPEGWTVDDRSVACETHVGDSMWCNELLLTSADGIEVLYWDDFRDDLGGYDWTEVERIPAADGHYVMSWVSGGEGSWDADAAVLGREWESPNAPISEIDTGVEGRAAGARLGDRYSSEATFATEEEARAYLTSAPVREAMEVMAGIEQLGAPIDAMP